MSFYVCPFGVRTAQQKKLFYLLGCILFTEFALCSLLFIYLPIYNQSPLHCPTGVQPPQMQLQQLKLLTKTTRPDTKQRCNYVLSIGFLLYSLPTFAAPTFCTCFACFLFWPTCHSPKQTYTYPYAALRFRCYGYALNGKTESSLEFAFE